MKQVATWFICMLTAFADRLSLTTFCHADMASRRLPTATCPMCGSALLKKLGPSFMALMKKLTREAPVLRHLCSKVSRVGVLNIARLKTSLNLRH